MIRFDNVSKRYQGGYEALDRVTFELASGEFAFLTGHSGAGKSTLLKLIMLIERVSQGQIWVDGKNLARLPARQIPLLRRSVGVVFQNHQLLFDRNVYENVALPLIIEGYPAKEAARRVRAALDKVGLLSREKANPVVLSGGEQQRVAVARAVANAPRILLLDEPTGNLDPNTANYVFDALSALVRASGVATLFATHNLELAGRMDRAITLEDGLVKPLKTDG